MNAQQFLVAQLLAVEHRIVILNAVVDALKSIDAPQACIDHVRGKMEAFFDGAVTWKALTKNTTHGVPITQPLDYAVASLVAQWDAERNGA